MRSWLAALALGLVWAVASHPYELRADEQAARWYVLHCGTLLSVPGEAPIVNVSVVVKGRRIYEIRSGFVDGRTIERPADVEVLTVDLKDSFVLPGLIDAHTHVTLESWRERGASARPEGEAQAAIVGVAAAEKLLRAGVTTVRDLGARGDAVFVLRDAIRDGTVPGPRMVIAGAPITPTGGHSDGGDPWEPWGTLGPREGVADGPFAVRSAVREQIRRGADVVKLTATGGVLSETPAGFAQELFDDELQEAVSTARRLGRKVAAHAHGADGIKAALRAGVDSIEHGTFLDDEAIALFRERGTFLVPTLLAGETVAENARRAGFYPPEVERKALEVGPQLKVALARAHAAGVRIAFGTDSGVTEPGRNARELALMVEAGMTEMEALVAATSAAAELLGLSDEIGRIAPGLMADLIATQRNPLVDITELQRVRFVMREGSVFRYQRSGSRR